MALGALYRRDELKNHFFLKEIVLFDVYEYKGKHYGNDIEEK